MKDNYSLIGRMMVNMDFFHRRICIVMGIELKDGTTGKKIAK